MPAASRDALAAERFRVLVEPHLDAAYNLARWLTRNPHDADDVVQEAYLRAFRYFDSYRGGDALAWLLSIVRNTSYTWLAQQRGVPLVEYDEADAGLYNQDEQSVPQHATDPQTLLLRAVDGQQLEKAMRKLPRRYRELLVLRVLEDLSYKQIAAVADVPIGTVMSRLARARALMRNLIDELEYDA